MEKAFLLVACALLLTQVAEAAVIKGSVYDFSLQPATALITINTTPVQKVVAKGSYSLEVPPGNYLLRAESLGKDLLPSTAEEHVLVEGEGEYLLDLILFPAIGAEDANFSDIAVEFSLEEQPGKGEAPPLLALALAALILAAAFKLKPWRKKRSSLDEDAAKVYEFVKRNGRVPQKELRKEFPYSEAKLSLIVAELEEKGLVRKVKKGRGNLLFKN